MSRSAVGAQHLGVHGDGRREEGDVAGVVSAAQPGLAPADGAELLSQLLHLPGEARQEGAHHLGTPDLPRTQDGLLGRQ